jgi:6-phosphogluconolactonase (cycloisomerase 2 family)
MKTNIIYLTCAIVAGTHLANIGEAQVTTENSGTTGAVYAMTNDPSDNKILVYNRDGNGQLSFGGPVSTRGRGSGGIIDPLESQGSLAFGADHKFLFAANAGSGTISSFSVHPSNLVFVGEVASGGAEPLSITVQANLLYVLNAASISGFRIQSVGRLEPIPSSTRFLAMIGGRDLGSSDIAFSPDAHFLVITQRLSNQIVVFPVRADGTTGTPVQNTSNGNTPFSCGFTSGGVLIVAESDGGPGGSSAASSYSIASDGMLQVISPSVPTQGTVACWNVISTDGKFAVVTNAGSSDETLFSVTTGGQLGFISATSAGTNTVPLDTALTPNNLFLYTLDAAAGAISEFRFDESSQSLVRFGKVSDGLTPNSGLNGLEAR